MGQRGETWLFTHHLLNALHGAGDADGDGLVTAAEAKRYLDETMTISARRTYGRRQNATLNGLTDAVLARASQGTFPARSRLDEEGLEKPAEARHGPSRRPDKAPKAKEDALALKRSERVLVQDALSSMGFSRGRPTVYSEARPVRRYERGRKAGGSRKPVT